MSRRYYDDFSGMDADDQHDIVLQLVREVTNPSDTDSMLPRQNSLLLQHSQSFHSDNEDNSRDIKRQDDSQETHSLTRSLSTQEVKRKLLYRQYSTDPQRSRQVVDTVNESRSRISREVLARFGNQDQHEEIDMQAELEDVLDYVNDTLYDMENNERYIEKTCNGLLQAFEFSRFGFDHIFRKIYDAIIAAMVELVQLDEAEDNRLQWCKRYIDSYHLSTLGAEDNNDQENESQMDFAEIVKLADDFNSVAALYAKTIVREYALQEKTVKMVSVGGIAGGKKFIARDILFKAAMDDSIAPDVYLYGGEAPNHELAMKAASHELIGAIQYGKHLPQGFYVPMQTIVDYRGFRIVAMPLLPISHDTLVYGSDDAGNSIQYLIDEVIDAMKRAAERLHLAGHIVLEKELFAAGDVEVHQDTDSNFHVLDLARCFPPESPVIAHLEGLHLPLSERTIFCRKLRPELLQHLKTVGYPPLSPDAFTGWGRFDDNFELHNLEVHKATAFLLKTRIPELAKHIDLLPRVIFERCILSHIFHKYGVNMRHLGYVLTCCQQEYVKDRLVVELIIRTIKNIVRQIMRKSQLKSSGASSYSMKCQVAAIFNIILESDMSESGQELSSSFWTQLLPGEVFQRFGSLAVEEVVIHSSRQDSIQHRAKSIVLEVATRCGIQFKPDSIALLRDDTIPKEVTRLVGADFDEFTTSLKSLTILDASLGRLLLKEASEFEVSNNIQGKRLRAMALTPLSNVMVHDPYNTFIARLYAMQAVLSLHSEMDQEHLETEALNAMSLLPDDDNDCLFVKEYLLQELLTVLLKLDSCYVTPNLPLLIALVSEIKNSDVIVLFVKVLSRFKIKDEENIQEILSTPAFSGVFKEFFKMSIDAVLKQDWSTFLEWFMCWSTIVEFPLWSWENFGFEFWKQLKKKHANEKKTVTVFLNFLCCRLSPSRRAASVALDSICGSLDVIDDLWEEALQLFPIEYIFKFSETCFKNELKFKLQQCLIVSRLIFIADTLGLYEETDECTEFIENLQENVIDIIFQLRISKQCNFLIQEISKIGLEDQDLRELEDAIEQVTDYLENLTKLKICYKAKTLDDGIFSMNHSLIELMISGNDLNVIPDTLFHPLISLKRLTLSSNQLTEIAAISFENLKRDLSKNELSFLDANIFFNNANLESLSLKENNFEMIVPGLFQPLEKLKFLNLDNNMLYAIQKEDFSNLKQLQLLNLRGNGLVEIAEEGFHELSNLQRLDLSGNILESLSRVQFLPLKFLRHLFLQSNRLRDFEVSNLFHLKYLETLNLKNSGVCVDVKVVRPFFNRKCVFLLD